MRCDLQIGKEKKELLCSISLGCHLLNYNDRIRVINFVFKNFNRVDYALV
jgi:hypothetical protein